MNYDVRSSCWTAWKIHSLAKCNTARYQNFAQIPILAFLWSYNALIASNKIDQVLVAIDVFTPNPCTRDLFY